MKNSHDRHANLETAYLLRRIETYPGLLILATSFVGALDEAVVWRLDCVIQFPADRSPKG